MLEKEISKLFVSFSEESKPDSDLDEPWIMTVKGLNHHNFKNQSVNDEIIVSPVKQHNGANNGSARDLNLNHYKINNQVRYNKIFYLR